MITNDEESKGQDKGGICDVITNILLRSIGGTCLAKNCNEESMTILLINPKP